ncbi:response regulator [Pseudoalteromonas citrea]|uniref:Response regulator n=1 Tax=Pseudoalteromonas citrea TaxID=43655 RepID=A0A5S3XST4_9GAMM|nr:MULTISPECIES: HDOD domain-containing protein [Pseudoalteromonas]RJE73600.1 response regulator [Pseudoalteromonas sp. MSK9-3]TMP41031.1 response regulator [Pseudoalteromonas citrea]TMP60097.1 response regulator [Pseudoalteromonas citrea]
MPELKLNILLIDDDELLLRALSRTLSRMYRQAHVTCLQYPEEFMNCVENNGMPDVIFCDSMMPIVSGIEVLKRAKEVCPGAIRCLLTGDLKDSYQWQMDNTIHFHLVKPFTQTHLTQVIECTLLLEELPISKSTRAILGQLSELPYLSSVAQNLLQELGNEQPDMMVLADMVSHDPIMMGKILQVANSAFMGFEQHTNDFKQAIIRIGLEGLEAIAVCCTLSQQLLNHAKQDEIDKIIKGAFGRATMAHCLAKRLGKDTQSQRISFAAGLLSSVGELTYSCLIQLEKDKDRVSKNALTAYLLALWGFEREVVRAQLVDELPLYGEASPTLIHKIVEHVYNNGGFDLKPADYELLDKLNLLQVTQDWFFEWQKTQKGNI